MLRSVWDAYNDTHPDKPLINPRNAAAGTLVHKSPEACVAEGRTLRFFAFDLDAPDIGEGDVSARLGELGFEVPDVFEAADAEDEVAGRDRGRSPSAATSYDFDIDGAVIRLASRRAYAAAGATSAAPRGALAWKYPAEERTTVLRDVTWPVGQDRPRRPARARSSRCSSAARP